MNIIKDICNIWKNNNLIFIYFKNLIIFSTNFLLSFTSNMIASYISIKLVNLDIIEVIIEEIIFEIIDKVNEVRNDKLPLLWYFSETTSSENKKQLEVISNSNSNK